MLVSPKTGHVSPPPEVPDPSVLGYLKSRLRPGPKIREFQEQLRDAVIVRDIRSAVELWLRHPALNFVTPQGDLLLSSGLLKLGRQEEGAFALGREIRNFEDRLSRRSAELAPLAAELEKKGQEATHLEEEIAAEAIFLEELGKKIHELEKRKIAEESEREKSAGAVTLLKKELDILRQDKSALYLSRESLLQKTGSLEEDDLSGRCEGGHPFEDDATETQGVPCNDIGLTDSFESC